MVTRSKFLCCSTFTGYFGFPVTDHHFFTTELISKVINELKCGRAADIDGLMAEHLIKAHQVLPVILSKLFRLIVLFRHVPTTFGYTGWANKNRTLCFSLFN